MKKSLVVLLFFTLYAVGCTLYAEKLLPYYEFNFAEGVSVPSKGDFFANHEVGTKLGGIYSATDRLKFFGLYDLAYEGPGLFRSEGRLFSERAIRHSLMFEPSYEVPMIATLKTRAFSIVEKRRSGTNELWGKGLYDYNAIGFSVGFERELVGWSFTPSARYTTMDFPNYTDLLREFQSAGLTAEIAGGLIDQKVYAVGFLARRKSYVLDATYTLQNFDRERVLQANGTYADQKQQDKTYSFSANSQHSLWRFTAVPKLGLTMKRSNQNFLRSAYFGDPAPVFVEKNYDYNQYQAASAFLTRLTERKFIYMNVDANWRNYAKRQPRDASNNYIAGETQKSFWASYSFGYRWKSTDYTTWTLAYSFIFASSNMKFQSFIPSNYTGHNIGLYFSVAP